MVFVVDHNKNYNIDYYMNFVVDNNCIDYIHIVDKDYIHIVVVGNYIDMDHNNFVVASSFVVDNYIDMGLHIVVDKDHIHIVVVDYIHIVVVDYIHIVDMGLHTVVASFVVDKDHIHIVVGNYIDMDHNNFVVASFVDINYVHNFLFVVLFLLVVVNSSYVLDKDPHIVYLDHIRNFVDNH